jgi:predicted HTH transcriptional regulator
MGWPAKGTDERARLIRHMIGLGNSRDGGHLLIGVDNATKKATGLTLEQASSWDPSPITEALSQFGAPVPRIDICQGEASDRHLLVLVHVAEFDQQPCVCIQNHARKESGLESERLILRKGALYVRTVGAITREIDSEPMMRDLLKRAYARTGQGLLQQIKELIDTHVPDAPKLDSSRYDAELRSDFEEMGWP